MNMQIHHFEKKGREKRECDDVFYMVHTKGKSMFLLADGVTDGRFSKEGIYSIAECLGSLLFHTGIWTEESLKGTVSRMVQNTIGELARKNQCDRKEFASTLLIVFMTEEEEEIWILHLGDGALFHLDEEGNISILSYPHYGILKQYTYTTASKKLYHLLRVSKKQADGWIFGMTDGMMNEIMEDADTVKPEYAIMIRNKDWNNLKRSIHGKALGDDASFFAIASDCHEQIYQMWDDFRVKPRERDFTESEIKKERETDG